MSRLPLPVVIPVAAAAMVLGIGIPIGLLFLEVHDQASEDTTLIVAVVMTVGIMAVAALLSFRWGWTPDPPTIVRGGRAAATDAANDPRAAVGLAKGAAGKGDERARRRGSDRRRNR